VGVSAVRESLRPGDPLRQANARVVAARAESLRDADPRAAMRLSVAAWKLAPVTEARAALQASLDQAEVGVFTAAAGPDASYRLAGDSLVAWTAGTVTYWDVPGRRLRATYALPRETVALSDDGAYAETRDGGLLAVATGLPATGVTTTITNGERTGLYAGDRRLFTVTGRKVALSADGRRAAVSGPDGRVEMWDVPRRAVIRVLRVPPAATDVPPPLSFSPDGRLLAVAGARTALVGEVATTTIGPSGDLPAGNARTLTTAVPGRTVSPSDGRAALAGTSAAPVLPGALTGAGLPAGGGPDPPVFSPDGSLLALASDGTVKLWRVRDRLLLKTLTPHSYGHGYTFSGDGRALHYLSGTGSVVSLDVSATVDAAIGGDPARAVRAVCAKSGGALSEDEWRRFIPETGFQEVC